MSPLDITTGEATEKPEGSIVLAGADFDACIMLGDLVDFAAERARIEKAIAKAEKELAGAEKTLANEGFIAHRTARRCQIGDSPSFDVLGKRRIARWRRLECRSTVELCDAFACGVSEGGLARQSASTRASMVERLSTEHEPLMPLSDGGFHG